MLFTHGVALAVVTDLALHYFCSLFRGRSFSDLKMNNSRLERGWIVLVLLTTNSWRPFKRDVFEVNIVVVLKELI